MAGERAALCAAVVCALIGPIVSTAPAVAAAGAQVDLYVADRNSPVLTPNVGGIQEITVSNRGQSTTGRVSVKYTTPVLVNIDRAKPMPTGCAILYQNEDSAVPEVVECVLPGLASGERHTITLPITLVEARAPTAGSYGSVSVTPAVGSADVEQDITTSLSPIGVQMHAAAGTPPPRGNPVNLFAAGDIPAIRPGGSAWTSLIVGNTGDQPTTGPVRAVYVTALYSNIDNGKRLPDDCTKLLDNRDPTVPEIVECYHNDPLAPGQTWTLRLPLTVVKGGPVGERYGASIATTGSSQRPSHDYDTNLADNLHGSGLNVTSQ
jgi:hypothetical protein